MRGRRILAIATAALIAAWPLTKPGAYPAHRFVQDGRHVADLPAAKVRAGNAVRF
jgi:hypothetical protein